MLCVGQIANLSYGGPVMLYNWRMSDFKFDKKYYYYTHT